MVDIRCGWKKLLAQRLGTEAKHELEGHNFGQLCCTWRNWPHLGSHFIWTLHSVKSQHRNSSLSLTTALMLRSAAILEALVLSFPLLGCWTPSTLEFPVSTVLLPLCLWQFRNHQPDHVIDCFKFNDFV